MNRSSSNQLALSKAINGYRNYKAAEGLSDRTIDSYKRILQQWAQYTGEIQMKQLTSQISEVWWNFPV